MLEPIILPEVPVTSGLSPPGTRQMLLAMGPKKFAEWARKQKRLVTDTTFRDAHQSLLATRSVHRHFAVAEAVSHRLLGFSASKCGVAPRSTHRCVSCWKTPGSGCANCVSWCPTSAFRCCCGRPMRLATPAIQIMLCRSLSRSRHARASTSSESSIR